MDLYVWVCVATRGVRMSDDDDDESSIAEDTATSHHHPALPERYHHATGGSHRDARASAITVHHVDPDHDSLLSADDASLVSESSSRRGNPSVPPTMRVPSRVPRGAPGGPSSASFPSSSSSPPPPHPASPAALASHAAGPLSSSSVVVPARVPMFPSALSSSPLVVRPVSSSDVSHAPPPSSTPANPGLVYLRARLQANRVANVPAAGEESVASGPEPRSLPTRGTARDITESHRPSPRAGGGDQQSGRIGGHDVDMNAWMLDRCFPSVAPHVPAPTRSITDSTFERRAPTEEERVAWERYFWKRYYEHDRAMAERQIMHGERYLARSIPDFSRIDPGESLIERMTHLAKLNFSVLPPEFSQLSSQAIEPGDETQSETASMMDDGEDDGRPMWPSRISSRPSSASRRRSDPRHGARGPRDSHDRGDDRGRGREGRPDGRDSGAPRRGGGGGGSAGGSTQHLKTPAGHHFLRVVLAQWKAAVTIPASDALPQLERSTALFGASTREAQATYSIYLAGLKALGDALNVSGLCATEPMLLREHKILMDSLQSLLLKRIIAMGSINVSQLYAVCRQLDPGVAEQQLLEVRDESKRKEPDLIRLLKLLYDKAKLLELIRIDSEIYEYIYTKDGIRTCAVRRYGETGQIGEFIENSAYPMEVNKDIWDLLNGAHKMSSWVEARMLQGKYREGYFPKMKRNRHWHGFPTGLLDVKKSIEMRSVCFYTWNSAQYKQLPIHEYVACRNHESEFDLALYSWYLRPTPGITPGREWMDLPTPVDELIHQQRWNRRMEEDPEPKRMSDSTSDEPIWIYAEGAHMLLSKKVRTPLSQRLPLHVGAGGCGKTTLLLIYSSFFESKDVMQFKTKDEEVFGADGLQDAYIWMIYDLGRYWKMEHTFLFNLIDGNQVKISRKRMKHVSTDVDQPGMIAMNEHTQIPDTGGAYSGAC